MSKKIISIFTMGAFIVFSLSCTTTKIVRLDADTAKEDGKIRVVQVVIKSGEIIEFSKDQPGRIHNGSITGRAVKAAGELDKAYIIEKEIDKKGNVLSFMVSIPLSEVEVMMIVDEKFDLGKAFGVLLLLGMVVVLGLGIWWEQAWD